MTRLVLVRHGETVWHAENRYAGSSDVALTEAGHEQAEALAVWAATAGIAECVTSTLSRTVTTARPAAEAAGVALTQDERLRELDFGRGEGRTAEEMEAELGGRYQAFLDDPVHHPLPGGEDPRRAIDRAVGCLREVAAPHRGERVLVVWHSTVMRLVLCHLIGIRPSTYRQVFPAVRNGAITEIRLHDTGCELLTYNAPLPATGERRPS